MGRLVGKLYFFAQVHKRYFWIVADAGKMLGAYNVQGLFDKHHSSLFLGLAKQLKTQSGKTAKRGIPQLRYIYRDCGIYSVFMFLRPLFFNFFILRQSKLS